MSKRIIMKDRQNSPLMAQREASLLTSKDSTLGASFPIREVIYITTIILRGRLSDTHLQAPA